MRGNNFFDYCLYHIFFFVIRLLPHCVRRSLIKNIRHPLRPYSPGYRENIRRIFSRSLRDSAYASRMGKIKNYLVKRMKKIFYPFDALFDIGHRSREA